MPHAVLHPQEILNGGVDICREAGIPLAGGHSIDSPEPIFGLVVTGVVDPNLVKRNSAAQVGRRPFHSPVFPCTNHNGLCKNITFGCCLWEKLFCHNVHIVHKWSCLHTAKLVSGVRTIG